MRLKYLLSNKQKTELLVRGRRHWIALPSPLYFQSTPLEWARSVLVEDVAALVAEAREDWIWTRVTSRHPGPTLTDVLGAICLEPERDLALRVDVVIVELVPLNSRRQRPQVQWPRSVLIDGVEYPERRDENEE